jgi:hypothetical protein
MCLVMICTKFDHPQTKIFFGTQYKRHNVLAYSTTPLVKNTSKPCPKELKRAAIELWTAKVSLALKNK